MPALAIFGISVGLGFVVWGIIAAQYLMRGPTTPPPPDGSSGKNRVIRGGSWVDVALGCSSPNRFYANPRLGNSVQGFRLAAVPSRE
jgi:hypothetical protein